MAQSKLAVVGVGMVLAYKLQSVIKGSHGRNSGQELEAETRGMWPTGLLPGSQLAVFLTTHGHLPRDGTIHYELGLSTTNQKKNVPNSHLMEAVPKLRFPIPEYV